MEGDIHHIFWIFIVGDQGKIHSYSIDNVFYIILLKSYDNPLIFSGHHVKLFTYKVTLVEALSIFYSLFIRYSFLIKDFNIHNPINPTIFKLVRSISRTN